MLSSTWLCISRASSPPQRSMIRSASVDLPWSMCAMIAKLRMRWRSVMEDPGSREAGSLPYIGMP
jgi:hypothetical protein